MEKKKYVEAGKIVNTHGIAGELKIEVWLDSPAFFKRFKRLFIEGREYRIAGGRVHKDFFIAKLEGIDDINAAMPFKEKTVSVSSGDAGLGRGDFFLQDLIGAEVIDEKQGNIGRLREIMEAPASMVYIVEGSQEHLIPAVPEFILSQDPEEGIIRVRLIEGM